MKLEQANFKKPILVISIAILYFVFSYFGMLITITPKNIGIFWIPAGIALFTALTFGRIALIGTWLGSFAFNFLFLSTFLDELQTTIIISVITATGAMLQAFCGKFFLKKRIKNEFNHIRLAKIFFLAGASCLISPTFGVTSLCYFNFLGFDLFFSHWGLWFVGDFLGVIIAIPVVIIFHSELRKNYKKALITVCLPIFCGQLAAVSAFVKISSNTLAQEKKDLQLQTLQLSHRIQYCVENNISLLKSVKSFIELDESLLYDDFKKFTQEIIKGQDGLLAISWNPIVNKEQRLHYEQQAQHLFPQFCFKTKDAKGQEVISPVKDKYVVVYFIEPLAGNEKALGYDVYSQKDRKVAMDFAEQYDTIAITAPINLIQLQEYNRSVLIFVPVHKPSQGIVGYVTGVVRLDSMVHSSSENILNEFDVYVEDTTHDLSSPQYIHGSLPQKNNWMANHLLANQKITVANRIYTITSTPKSQIFTDVTEHIYWLVLLTIFISIILSILFLQEEWHKHNVENLVLLRTQELQNAKEEAEKANSLKDNFITSISHEVRTPLNGIMGNTELLLTTDMTEEQQEFVKTIRISSEILLSLVNDFLDISKIESGKVQLEKKVFSLCRCIEDVYELLAWKAAQKQIDLLYHLDLDKCEVIGDQNRLRQVLLNLVYNAIKNTDSGQIILSVVRLNQTEQNITLKFAIEDSGKGIPQDKLESIFQPFLQLPQHTQVEGTGLGLSITKKFVDAMEGVIYCRNNPEKGCTFFLELSFGICSDSKPRPVHSLQNKSVLLVDENPHVLKMLSQILEGWSIQTIACDNYSDAINYNGNVDLCICDARIKDNNIPFYQKYFRSPVLVMTFVPLSNLGEKQQIFKPVLSPILWEKMRNILITTEKRIQQKKSERLHNSPEKFKILVAEDDPMNLKIILAMLKNFGYTVCSAMNGAEVLQTLEKESFDMILMDIQMPIMNGITATQKIRQMDLVKYPVIIAITASAMKGFREKLLDSGMQDYVSKPFTFDSLKEKIEYWRTTSR